MDKNRRLIVAGLALGFIVACGEARTQTARADSKTPSVRPDLYDCEGCEAALERDPASLAPTIAIASANEPGERMIIEGVVYQTDGHTPAANVVIYAHHTNAAGYYGGGTPETEFSHRHGRLRGWIKTGPDGRYRFNSIKPAPYPNERMPAHVHLTVREPGRQPYWIDDITFEGEFGVSEAYRRSQAGRGGSGIIRLTRSPQRVWIARRNIVLERHPD